MKRLPVPGMARLDPVTEVVKAVSQQYELRKVAKAAPDLKIVLSPHEPDDASSRNALRGGVILGQLESNKGRQAFSIDESIDLNRFASVLIHCEQYTKLWGAAELHEGQVLAYGADWTRKSKKTRGAFEIAQASSGQVIRFASDFKTSKAPEPLRIVLSEHTITSASSKNAMQRGTVIGLTGTYKGGHEVRLRADVAVKPGMTLLLHCEKYTKLWSAADITIVP